MQEGNGFGDDLIAGAVAHHGEGAVVAALEELRRGDEVQKVLAKGRQERLAKSVDRLARARMDGIGQMIMRVDASAYHAWGTRLGYECWKDKGFRREYARDNEAVRVKAPAGPAVVLVERKLKPRTEVAR